MLIDSSLVQTFVNRRTIQELSDNIKILHFKAPFEALRYLINLKGNLASFPNAILIDFYGKQPETQYFLKQFSQFPEEVQLKCKVHITSLEFSKDEYSWLKSILNVSSVIQKPLIADHFIDILS